MSLLHNHSFLVHKQYYHTFCALTSCTDFSQKITRVKQKTLQSNFSQNPAFTIEFFLRTWIVCNAYYYGQGFHGWGNQPILFFAVVLFAGISCVFSFFFRNRKQKNRKMSEQVLFECYDEWRRLFDVV